MLDTWSCCCCVRPHKSFDSNPQAEAAYWQRSEGYKVGWSDELLGFDCGGQQWVLEAAFPTGTLRQGAQHDT